MTREMTYEQLKKKAQELEQKVSSMGHAENRLKHQSEYLLALHETTLGIMNRLDKEDLLQTILERAAFLTGTKNAFVYMLEPFETKIEIRIAVGFFENLIGFRIGHGEGLAGRVWKTAQPLLVEDYHAWEDRVPDKVLDVLRSVIGIPLISGKEVVGVIGLGHIDDEKGFGDDDVAVLSRFAELASIALDNVRLYEHLRKELAVRKRTEKELKRINRTLRALSDCNQVLVHATDETSLLEKICRIIVDVGGYRLAWVGFVEKDEDKTVRPVAQAGYEDGYLDTVEITWADTERGRGPTGTAIRTEKAYICRNAMTDPEFAPWRDEAIKRGYNSVMSTPLIADDCTLGAITVYSSQADAFDAEEAKLMNELADDLAYGIVSLHNRSERNRAEKELQKAYDQLETKVEERTRELAQANIKLQELDRLKSMFIASMSHELRTPLNSIIGFTGIILQGISGEINPEQRKQLTMVKNSANHLLALINDVIDLSKIESGKIELLIKEFDLSSVIKEVEESLEVTASNKGLRLSAEVPERLMVEGDERRTKQIVMNMVSNAVKYTERGEIDIKAKKSNGRIEISVRDTGIGIRKEHIVKLFKAFSRIREDGMPIHEGTGLGLYLSKKIADLLGGEIKAQSEKDKGSLFTFSLPLKHGTPKIN